MVSVDLSGRIDLIFPILFLFKEKEDVVRRGKDETLNYPRHSSQYFQSYFLMPEVKPLREIAHLGFFLSLPLTS